MLDDIFSKLKSPNKNTKILNEETKSDTPAKETILPNQGEVLDNWNWEDENTKLDDEYLLDDKIEDI